MPSRKAFYGWVAADFEVRRRYELALRLRVEAYVDETVAIADDSSGDKYVDKEDAVRVDHDAIARAKLKIDARWWYAAKILPKKHGGKWQVDIDMTARHSPAEIDERIAAMLKKATGSGQNE